VEFLLNTDKRGNSSFLRELVSALKPYRTRLILGLSAAAMATVFDVVSPMLLRSGVNALQESRPVGWLYSFAGLIVMAAFIGGVFRFYMRNTVIGISRWAESDIRETFFGHILSLAPAFFDRNLTGDLMARATEDVERVRMVLGPALQFSVTIVLTLILSAAMMFYLDPYLAALVMLLAPVIGGMVLLVWSRLHRANLRQQETYGKLGACVQENLTGIRVIKAFVREAYESGKFADLCQLYFRRSMVVVRLQSIFMPVLTMLIGFGISMILWVGGQKVVNGQITLGDFIAFMSYLSLMTWPMVGLGWTTYLYQRGAASYRRLDEILSVPEQFGDVKSSMPQKKEVPEEAPAITFRNIHFRYRDDDPKVFTGLNLTIPPGSVTAVVGRTGSGKSTLLRLLSRLYTPQNGEITLNGYNWDSLPVSTLRGMIGFVDQTPFLFSASVRQNIAFGNPAATDDEIEAAARLACFNEDIADFPEAYNSEIGERGVTLSGGQQQRLTIARALLIDTPILVLDDALSAVDTGTESEIIHNLTNQRNDRTILFVTHRLSAAERADLIVVLDRGVNAEFGTHEELIDRNGIYAAMYRRQRLSEELGAMS